MDVRELHPVVERADIAGFPNIAVHEYFAISWSIVWITAIQDVPDLRREVVRIQAKDYSEKLP